MNNNYNQPIGGYNQPVGQPNNGAFNVGGKSVNKNTMIIGVVAVVVVAIIAFVAFSGGSSKKITGEWECSGSNGTATINITKDKFEMTMKVYGQSATISGKYSKVASNFKGSKTKSGYSYAQYKIKNAKRKIGGTESDLGNGYGFTFGVSKDGKSAHYLDGMGNSASYNYECTKK